MRGKVEILKMVPKDNRITPAYAGKSWRRLHGNRKCEDHPRLCGEKFDQLSNIMCTTGSPPPMRGKDISGRTRNWLFRITPAYAGKR